MCTSKTVPLSVALDPDVTTENVLYIDLKGFDNGFYVAFCKSAITGVFHGII